MSKVQMLRLLVKQRLTAAAEEIFVLFERTIAEYEEELCRSKEENERQRQLLDAVFKPQLRLHRADFTADVQQLLVSKEEVPPEQQEWSSSLDHENPSEPPHIKEELWTSQDGELLQGLEEADITKFMFTPVLLNSEDDDEEPQSSQLHQRQTEQMKREADEEDCGGPEPAKNSDPDRRLPDTEENTGDRSENEVSDDYWEETGESCKSWKTDEVPLSDVGCKTGKKTFICSECGERFDRKANLKLHIRVHTGDEPFRCSVCGSGFSQKENLINHMIRHTADKPFSCSVCKKSFRYGGNLLRHMKSHAKDNSFSCSLCGRAFSREENLQIHMRIHAEEKPFSCPFCGKSFTQNEHLTLHMSVHTEENRFSCALGDRRFTPGQEFKQTHRCVGESSQFHQSQSIARDPAGSSTEQMETESHGEDHGEPEPAKNSDPVRHLHPDTDDKTEDSSEFKIEISDDDWVETTDPRSGSNPQKNNGVAVSDKTADQPISCSECGKIFRRKYCLQIHKRIHTGEKPFSCSVCGKRFSQRNTFIEHTRRHTGQDMFNCSLCGKKFAFKFRLRNHMRTHTGEKPFSCSVCSKGFRYNGELVQHMNVHLTQ